MQTKQAALATDPGATERCFHCAEPMPAGNPVYARIDGLEQPMCCTGCKAVAEFIADTGLSGFYSVRDTPSAKAASRPEAQPSWDAYDNASFQDNILSRRTESEHEAIFLVEGIRCAACTWLIEQSVGSLDGVISCEANPATSKAVLSWDPRRIRLSEILQRLARLGFIPHAVADQNRSQSAQQEQRLALRRLLVAGLGMMQVLMFAVALYMGIFEGMDASARDFLRLVSLIVATPVVVYSGYPFFAGAARDLQHARAGMDVPVAIAISAAYLASLWVTLRGGGEVYFDSATMFVFLLSAARYMEMKARHRSAETADALQSLMPQLATLIDSDGEKEVPIGELAIGDRLLVRPGAIIPADGRVCWGRSAVDESMFTGEFEPRPVDVGGRLIAGSQNLGQALQMTVKQTGEQTAAAAIRRMIENAQARKPGLSSVADIVARWFVSGLLLLTTAVALYWYINEPTRAFSIALSLLVVSCPCALALATPAAFTAVMDRLARDGILVTRGDAIEALAKTRHMLLDKTGTLTEGRYQLLQALPAAGFSSESALRIAAQLEKASEHPVARAFEPWSDGRLCDRLVVHSGEGLEGTIDGCRYCIGTPEFTGRMTNLPSDAGDDMARAPGETTLALASESAFIAFFVLGDKLRPDAREATQQLTQLGMALEIASGASHGAVRSVAQESGIVRSRGELKPEDKLRLLRERQAAGESVAMVGDGINDAPVLAAANVSLAMGGGTALAHANADIIILGDRLTAIPDVVAASRKTLRVVRQNLGWAIAYNLTAIPLAAAGLIQPWLAAIGMSLSSLLVIANSLRLARRDTRRQVPETRLEAQR